MFKTKLTETSKKIPRKQLDSEHQHLLTQKTILNYFRVLNPK